MKLYYVWILFFALFASCAQKPQTKQPNIILIVCDDMGYKDLSCYGQNLYTTPNIDKLATGGVRFTDFYTAANVCTPSRASYLTGLYPNRHGLPGVLFPNAKTGLNPQLNTIPELLKQNGYATGLCGKWHMGDKEEFMPLNHGFDTYFGIPYSNDMVASRKDFPPLPLYLDKQVIETEPDQTLLTKRTTEFALDFITKNTQSPFFLMFTHIMPHVPLAVSADFKGKSGAGLYGDVMMEIDWSVEQIMKTLEQEKIIDNTLIIFTSDNGPWISFGNHGGNPGVFREGKFTTFEGGHRVPFIVWGKGIDKPATSNVAISGVDVLPTIMEYAHIAIDPKSVDGSSFLSVLRGSNELSNHNPIYFYKGKTLEAIRNGQWKYHTAHAYKATLTFGNNGSSGKTQIDSLSESLFDLENDPEEQENILELNKNEANNLKKFFP